MTEQTETDPLRLERCPQLVGHRSFWRGTQVSVDADVQCTVPMGHALEERVEAWRAPERAVNPQDQLEGGRR